ncbi:MAG: ATP-binding protein [Nanoarchaeota archaeon]
MAKYIITGGPCTGKSTLIRALQAQGYRCVDEVARQLIDEAERTGSDCHPARDFHLFQQHVVHRQLALEESVKHEPLVFFDRGIPDGIGYHWERGVDVPSYIADLAQTRGYAGVFVLARLGVYKQDAQRFEDAAQGQRVHDMICKAYAASPYPVHHVPIFDADQHTSVCLRVSYIKKHIGGDQNGTRPA